MAENRNESEIRRLMAEIDMNYQAAFLGLSGIALGTSLHSFINARMARIEEARAKLVKMVGEDEAAKLIVTQLEKSAESREDK